MDELRLGVLQSCELLQVHDRHDQQIVALLYAGELLRQPDLVVGDRALRPAEVAALLSVRLGGREPRALVEVRNPAAVVDFSTTKIIWKSIFKN